MTTVARTVARFNSLSTDAKFALAGFIILPPIWWFFVRQ